MSGEEIPITPALITWARERAGYSLEEASSHFKKIESWEAGEAFPTYPQLEQLAEKFTLPIAVFFFPEPPDVPAISESFRTLPDIEFQKLPRRIGYLLRKAKAMQINLAELAFGRAMADRLITKDLTFTPNVHVDEMAREVRDYIGVSFEDQYAWGDDDIALKGWRQALHDVGIFVFKDAFHLDEFSGFCLYDEVFPIIYANNSATKTRQIFTLFHELAHLLFHTSGIDTIEDSYIPQLPEQAQRIEALCNRFSAEFLIPDEVFDSARVGMDVSEATAEYIAARFNVSREVVYRKFLDRRLIDEATYTRAAVRWAAQRRPRGKGGDPYWTRISYLGRDYVSLALSQYHQNRINIEQLGDYLDTKPKHISTLESYFAQGGRDVRV